MIKSECFINYIRNIYNFYFNNNIIKMRGHSNTFQYNLINTRFKNAVITVRGNNNSIIIGNNCDIRGVNFSIKGDDNRIVLEEEVTINGSKLKPTIINVSGGTSVTIGRHSLLSNNIEITTTDYHGIYDECGCRINFDKDVFIGEHVWIGTGAKIMKGSFIPKNSIVGAASCVASTFPEENTIIAGNPARILKHNVFWTRNCLEFYLTH